MTFHRIVRGVFICVIVLVQFVFLVTILCGSDIIAVPPHYLKPMTYEYWNWLVETRRVYDSSLVDVVIVSKTIANAFLLLGLCYAVLRYHIQGISSKRMIVPLLFALLGYGIYFVYVRFFATHYYLPMMLIPTELLSISLFYVLYHSEASEK